MLYELTKSGHIVSLIIWIGGMMAGALVLMVGEATTVVRLRSWDRRVTTVAMLATWVFGLMLAMWGDWFSAAWLHIKLVFVLGLSALHGVLSGRLRRASPTKQPDGIALHISLAVMLISVTVVVLMVELKPV